MVHVLSPLRGDPGSLEDCSGGLLVVQPPDPQLAAFPVHDIPFRCDPFQRRQPSRRGVTGMTPINLDGADIISAVGRCDAVHGHRSSPPAPRLHPVVAPWSPRLRPACTPWSPRPAPEPGVQTYPLSLPPAAPEEPWGHWRPDHGPSEG
ncbi:unnamed protein product [Gadus morhua 'NCC']